MYYVHTYMTFQYKSSWSDRTIKRGGGDKALWTTKKKHFIFYYLISTLILINDINDVDIENNYENNEDFLD